MLTAEQLTTEATAVLGSLREAATIKAKLQGLLKAADALLEDRDLPKTVREDIEQLRQKLHKRWAEIADGPPQHVAESRLSERSALREFAAAPDSSRVPIVVIEAGAGNPTDKHYYTIDTLSRDYPIFEGRKMYADHPTASEVKERPERSLRDWVATVKDVFYNARTNAIEGHADIHVEWFRKLVEKARGEIGVSINALGSTRKGEINGQTYNVVDQIVAVRSVDFVTEAGAGGRIKSLYESMRKEEQLNMDLKGLTIAQLKENRADLVTAIQKETQSLSEKLHTDLAQLAEKNKALETKLVEVSASLLLRDIAESVKALVTASDLPDAAKARVATNVGGASFIENGQVAMAKLTEAVKAAITAEKDYLAKIIESGKIRHTGSPGTQTETQLKEARKSLWKSLGYDDATIKKMEEVRT